MTRTLFALAVIGLPIVLIFSWVYEMTPEGIKRESEINRSESIAPMSGRKLDRVIIGILVITLAYAMVGDFDNAIARLESLVDQFGPWELTVYVLDPVFDPVRDDPRFQVLADQNAAWLEQQMP